VTRIHRRITKHFGYAFCFLFAARITEEETGIPSAKSGRPMMHEFPSRLACLDE
jgi:hypothetical protein